MRPMTASGLAAAAIAACASPAWAQCQLEWSQEFAAGPGALVQAISAGPGPTVVGGEFTAVAGSAARRVAAYDGSWSPIGLGFELGQSCWVPPPLTVRALLQSDVPGAVGIVAGGNMTTWSGEAPLVARWDDFTWRAMPGLRVGLSDTCGSVHDLAIFDHGPGPTVYVCGFFGFPAGGIARWNGTEWEDPGGRGLGFGLDGGGYTMAVHDDGAGPALCIGGRFTLASGIPALNIARFTADGEWQPIGDGVAFAVEALIDFDEGPRHVLLAGGGEGATGRVMRWDGEAWSQLGETFDRRVRAFAIFDDGAGPTVYAGGDFTSCGGRPTRYLAKWDGARWVEAAGGTGGPVHALEPAEHGSARTLLVGGQFLQVGGGTRSVNIARLIGCATPCRADCDADGELTFFDFLCFQNEFAAGSLYADCDDNGAHDFFDFLCFQNLFAAGCP